MTLTPYLCVANAREAIDWYVRAFGGLVTYEPVIMEDGRVGHVEITIGESRFMMADEFPEIGVASPDPDRGSAISLHLLVEDTDTLAKQLAAAGATLERGPEDGPAGRTATLRDPFGHRWLLNSEP